MAGNMEGGRQTVDVVFDSLFFSIGVQDYLSGKPWREFDPNTPRGRHVIDVQLDYERGRQLGVLLRKYRIVELNGNVAFKIFCDAVNYHIIR